MYAADNQGLQSGACCLGTGTTYPCRYCEVHRDDVTVPDISEFMLRDFEEAKPFLECAFPAFCRSLWEEKQKKRKLISDSDKMILEYCSTRSFFPVFPAVLKFQKPYPDLEVCQYFRADLMHSLIGLERNFIFYTYVITCRYARQRHYYGEFGQGPAKLDTAIANMHNLLQGSLPYEHSHFSKGVSVYCHSAKGKRRSKASQSGMGKLDSSKVKDLVLQMLICMFITYFFNVNNVYH